MVQPSILKSHKNSKMNETYFYRLSQNSQNHCWLSVKSMTPIFCSCCQCFTSNLLSYYLGYAISVHFFFWGGGGGEVATLLSTITCLWSELEFKQGPGKACSKIYKR